MNNPLDRTTATGVDIAGPSSSERSLDTVDASGAATATGIGIGKRASSTSSGRSSRSREFGPLELGTRVGEYVLERRLGAGGMGEVFAARHVVTSEIVALKTLSSTTATRLYRFKREFRALADVSHLNLIRLYELVVPDVGQTSISSVDSLSEVKQLATGLADGLAFFTMELLDGDPFVDWVRGSTPAGKLPDLARLETGLRQLVEGIVHLHAHDCIHRDIKPSNVLVTSDDRVVVLDFGLVSELSGPDKGITRDGQLLGTPSYMAPEQAIAARVSPATDHYAIGVMLYQCLTGQLPYRGSVMQQLIDKQSGPIPDPRDEVPNVPASLAELCMRLLAHEPEDRPTGQQLLELVRAKRLHGGEASGLFVGRKTELARLHAAAAELRAGTGAVVVHLRGASGSGKTMLARRFRDELDEAEIVMLQGRCREREAVPYKGVDALIDSLSAYLRNLPANDRASLQPNDIDALTRVFPVLDEIWEWSSEQILGLNEARALGWATLRKLLERTAERTPLILHIDDFQWADLDSVKLLEALLQPPGSPRIMLLISYRVDYRVDAGSSAGQQTEALRHLLDAELLSGEGVTKIDLEPLSSEDAQALADSLLESRGERLDRQAQRTRAAAIALRSAGNPLFIAQMALGGRELDSSDADIDHVLRRRLTEFDEPTRRVLELIAVYGGPMPAALALELSPTSSAGDIASLCEIGLLVREVGSASARDERVEVAHDRARTLVLERLSEQERTDLHARIGARLLELHDGAPTGDALYTVVNHLNAGLDAQASASISPEQRLKLAELNYETGKNALESTAWVTARGYLEQAFTLARPWLDDARAGQGQHALCVDVAFARAQALISLEQPEGDAAIEELLGWTLSSADFCRIAQWYAWHLFPTTRWDDCIAYGARVLPKLGVRMPHKPSWPRAVLSYFIGYRRLMRLGVDRIHTLPPITDERVHAALEILVVVCAQARAVDIKLHLTLMGTHARKLARHGFHDGAGVALTNLAMSAAALGQTERAKQLCEYARALPEHRSVSILTQSAAQAIEVWAVPLFRPARDALATTLQIYARLCDVAPKSQIGAVSVALAFTQLLAGIPLPEAMNNLVADQNRHEGQMIAVVESVVEMTRRCVDALMHGRTQPCMTDDLAGITDYYRETVTPVFEAMVDVLLGDYEAAWAWVSKISRSDERKIGPIWPTPALALFSVICISERWAGASGSERRRMQRISKRHRKTAKQWAGRCEATYAPMLEIIDGEIASRNNRHGEAIDALERARASAEAGQLTWLSALASERLAAAARRRGHLTLAETALDNARKAYGAWGAGAVVRRLQ